MDIVNPQITHRNGSAEVTFPITLSKLKEIKGKGLFNYQEMLFEQTPLSIPFNNGFIKIIGAESKVEHHKAGETLEIAEKEWQILYIELDQQRYPTFLHLKREGKIEGSLMDAMIEFATKKALENEPEAVEPMNAQNLKEFLGDFIDLGIQDHLNEETIAKVTDNFVSKLTGAYNDNQDLKESVQTCLEDKGIPVDFSEDSFYFSVQNRAMSWDVKLIVMEAQARLLAYSYISLDIDKNQIGDILYDINALNLTFSHGNFELNPEDLTLCFKNHIDVNPIGLEELFETLLEENFNSMRAIIPALKEKYGSIC
ncbi:MAG: hypothetical protein F6K42_05830 [Leptolyngbya sp. SIO1D8]|nr:hypothetical protein [Leptolyngbya sp. SIO1D8]